MVFSTAWQLGSMGSWRTRCRWRPSGSILSMVTVTWGPYAARRLAQESGKERQLHWRRWWSRRLPTLPRHRRSSLSEMALPLRHLMHQLRRRQTWQHLGKILQHNRMHLCTMAPRLRWHQQDGRLNKDKLPMIHGFRLLWVPQVVRPLQPQARQVQQGAPLPLLEIQRLQPLETQLRLMQLLRGLGKALTSPPRQ